MTDGWMFKEWIIWDEWMALMSCWEENGLINGLGRDRHE